MKRVGRFLLLLTLAISLLVSVVAVAVSASPVHIGGSRASFGVQLSDPSGGFTPLSTPVHIGGS